MTYSDMGAFGGLPLQFSDNKRSKIAVLPIPYDATSTWIKGADKGPDAIVAASANMELFDIETAFEVYRSGITTYAPLSCPEEPEKMIQTVYTATHEILNEGKFPVILGGEHSITYPVVKAVSEKYKDLSVLQLDAHSDMRDSYEGSPYNHACVMARVKDLCSVVQVGIRSMDIGERLNIDPERMVYAHEIHQHGMPLEKILNGLKKKVYITIDLDAFDPAYMPSTGTPEPGGLDWYQVNNLLAGVIAKRDIVGFDVVELCPSDTNKAPDFLAAKLIYRTLSMIFSKGSILI